jgi:hypothetical protein
MTTSWQTWPNSHKRGPLLGIKVKTVSRAKFVGNFIEQPGHLVGSNKTVLEGQSIRVDDLQKSWPVVPIEAVPTLWKVCEKRSCKVQRAVKVNF